jgi:beta-phosphoglucomutase-like phosphatase (HAD superfamily)
MQHYRGCEIEWSQSGQHMPELETNFNWYRTPRFPFCDRNRLEDVIFDWDGALVDSAVNYRRAYEMVLRNAGACVTPRESYIREGLPTLQLLGALRALRQISASETQIREMVECRRNYDAAVGRREFFLRICDLLPALRASGRKLTMVTGSSRRSVELVLTPEREC